MASLVGHDGCLFVVQHVAPDTEATQRRLRDLLAFYRPLGQPELVHHPEVTDGITAGLISFARGRSAPAPLTWGAPLPANLDRSGRLLEAGDRELRSITGVLAAVDARPGRCRVVSGACGLTTLYRAESDTVRVWATHAVAAAWLAHGKAALHSEAVPELLALGYVGDERTLLRGVRAVDPATREDLEGPSAASTSFWPRPERWERVPEAEAHAHTERALLEDLGARLSRSAAPCLGLTSGLDSRVAAVALAELGIQHRSFTWGDPEWPDVRGAQAVASAVGAPHRCFPVRWETDAVLLDRIEREVRWTEGLIPVGIAPRAWPDQMDGYAVGAGGEIGRAYYYRRAVGRYGDPNRAIVRRSWQPEGVLASSAPELMPAVRHSVDRWLDQAARDGVRGWRILDHVYAEQRVRRWGRGMLPRLTASVVPVFTTPEVARGLASLRLEDRANDGFHRRFVAEHRPALDVPHTPAPVAGVLRSRTRMVAAAMSRSLPRMRHKPTPAPLRWFAHERWLEQPAFREWLGEDVLGSAVVETAMGPAWAREATRGLMAGEPGPTESALLMASVVLLDRALSNLGKEA